MTYESALQYIHGRNRFAKKAGLENIRALLGVMGRPQEGLRFVHIAGTNGKGSTTSLIAAALSASGLRTAKFISPYVLDFRERFQIDGRMISPDELAECCTEVRRFADSLDREGCGPTEFELITAIAVLYFQKNACDIAVMETGLGGRLDATNALGLPLVSVITPIGLDHMEILGDTLEKIAAEKCGIIKEGGYAICSPGQPEEALQVIRQTAAARGAKLTVSSTDDAAVCDRGLDGIDFKYGGLSAHLGLLGRHQAANAVTAAQTLFLLRDVHGLPITDGAIARAFSGISFPARLEVISKDPAVLLDGAHNPHAMRALAEFLRPLGRPVGAVVGMVATKDMASSAAILGPVCRRVYAAGFSYPGAARAETVAAHFLPYCPDTKSFPTTADAIDCARHEMRPGELLLVCGSLYLASEARPVLLDRFGKTAG